MDGCQAGGSAFPRAAQATIRGFFSFSDEAVKQRGGEAFVALADWVRETAGERRRSPREDLITDLVRARDRGEAMSDDEIIILVAGLLGAGSETTAVGGLVAMRTLLEHEDTLEPLRADPSLLPNALRDRPATPSGAAVACPLRGARLSYAASRYARDRCCCCRYRRASGPERIPRSTASTSTATAALTVVGLGPDFCLGVHLALPELRCVVDAALDVLPPGARHRDDLVQWQRMMFFRRPENLPVDFGD